VEGASRVELAAKLFCHDEKRKRIRFKHTEKMGIDVEFMGKRDIDRVLRAIENQNNAMPAFLRENFNRVDEVLTTEIIELS